MAMNTINTTRRRFLQAATAAAGALEAGATCPVFATPIEPSLRESLATVVTNDDPVVRHRWVDDMVLNEAESGRGVFYINLARSSTEFIQSLIATKAGLPVADLIAGRIDKDSMPATLVASQEVSELKIYVSESPVTWPKDIEYRTKTLIPDIDLVVVDNLTGVSPDKFATEAEIPLSSILAELVQIFDKLKVRSYILSRMISQPDLEAAAKVSNRNFSVLQI